ncbi:MAG: hypothetical protein HGA45_01870 [Chloroflexales bacterium]|nr:hypothetical protein [Chloroflexales bacterium]
MRHRYQPARVAIIAQRPTWMTAPLLALLVLALAVVVASCGVASGDNPVPTQSADVAHQAWVTAVRAGDADAAVALADPELPQREQFAREAVSRMQDYLTSPASPTGALQDVTVEPVSDGVGRSIWQFDQKRWCYRAELVSRGERWYVSRWGQTSVDCQE